MSVIISKQMRVPSLGKAASDYAIGESVFLNVNGTPTEFLVVHQGLPDATLYDASCDGTWLLMKDVYTTMVWDSTDSDYENSDVHAYLNGDFLELFDSNVQSAIVLAKIPYVQGVGNVGVKLTGSDGLSTKVFLIGYDELGIGTFGNGAKLDYFLKGTTSTEITMRIAYHNGVATDWSTRHPHPSYTNRIYTIQTDGSHASSKVSNAYGVRPVLILPYDTKFDEETNTIKG